MALPGDMGDRERDPGQVEVRREDQQNINRFSTANRRKQELDTDMRELQARTNLVQCAPGKGSDRFHNFSCMTRSRGCKTQPTSCFSLTTTSS